MKTHGILPAGKFNTRLKCDSFLESHFAADHVLWLLDKPHADKVFRFLQRKPSTEFEIEIPMSHDDAGSSIGFITIRRKGGAAEMVIESYDRAQKWGILGFSDDAILGAIGRFQEAFEISCMFTPGLTGMYLLKNVYARMGAKSILEHPTSVEPFENPKDYALKWIRIPTEEEMRMPYLHSFDKNHSYMGASSINLGIGEWRHELKPVFKKDTPGVYRILIHDMGKLDPRLPSPFVGLEGNEWYYTPTLTLLTEEGVQFHCEEAYLFDDKRNIFAGWYAKVLEAKRGASSDNSQTGRCFQRMIKSMYTQTFGYLGSQFTQGWMHRPDWRNMIVSNAGQRMYRNALKVHELSGRRPVACYDDCLYYLSDSPFPADIAPFYTDKNLSASYKHKDSYAVDSAAAKDLFNQSVSRFVTEIKNFCLDDDAGV